MSKVDPNSFVRRPRVVFDREFSCRYNPGKVVTLKLRRLGKSELIGALNMAENKIVEFVTGIGIPGQKNYMPPMDLPPIGGEAVIISEGTARVAAIVFRAQTMPESERYTWDELISLMVSDDICEGFSQVAEEVTPLDDEEENSDPLASAARGKASSAIASTVAPQATPGGSSTKRGKSIPTEKNSTASTGT